MGNFRLISLSALIAAMVALSGCASGGAGEEEEEDGIPKKEAVFFRGGLVKDPWLLWLGSAQNWGGDTLDNKQDSSFAHGSVKVEPTQIDAPNDAKKVTWKGTGQFYIQGKFPKDYEGFIDADGALLVDSIVHEPPMAIVTTRVDCRYPCIGAVDTTAFYKAAPIGKKVTLKVPLKCFAKTGTKFLFVNTPWLVHTSAPFIASFGNVRWVPGAGKDADALKCAQ
jgi:beta-glucosidase